jgi:hypothetical protein
MKLDLERRTLTLIKTYKLERSPGTGVPPSIYTTVPLPTTRVASYPPRDVPDLQKHYVSRRKGEVSMGVWKRATAFHWELVFWISCLILAFLTIGALLAYRGFLLAR